MFSSFVFILSGLLYLHICQQHSLRFLTICRNCLSLLCPLQVPLNYHPYARRDCAATEGLVIPSLCLVGPPHFSVTAHCTSLVGSAKKVVVAHSFYIICEMHVLRSFGTRKGEEVMIIMFLCFPSQLLVVTPKYTC